MNNKWEHLIRFLFYSHLTQESRMDRIIAIIKEIYNEGVLYGRRVSANKEGIAETAQSRIEILKEYNKRMEDNKYIEGTRYRAEMGGIKKMYDLECRINTCELEINKLENEKFISGFGWKNEKVLKDWKKKYIKAMDERNDLVNKMDICIGEENE